MPDAQLEELSIEACVALLRGEKVGRLAVMDNDFPVILPINFSLVETSGQSWVAIRTRPGNVIDRAPIPVAFEIDGFDITEQEGWSVLVRGTLHHIHANTGNFADRFDPQPWMDADRDAWLVIEPFSITGRRLHASQPHWMFQLQGYL